MPALSYNGLIKFFKFLSDFNINNPPFLECIK
jgi:hypothetical protein